MTELAELFTPPARFLTPTAEKTARAIVALDLLCGAALAEAAAERWDSLFTCSPEERARRMEKIRQEARERAAREDAFKARNRVRWAEKTCATCKHGEDLHDDGCHMCKHPSLGEDSVITSEGMVCDAWAGASEGAEGEEAAV